MVWIRIQIGSGFSNSLDPEPDSATAWICITIQQQPVSGFGFRNILYPDPDSTKGLDLDLDLDQDPKRYL